MKNNYFLKMSLLVKFSDIISELETTHGSSIPVEELHQRLQKLIVEEKEEVKKQLEEKKKELEENRQDISDLANNCESIANKLKSSSVTSEERCCGLTKTKTQCSKKGSETGSDGKKYCKQHLGKSSVGESTNATTTKTKTKKETSEQTSVNSILVPAKAKVSVSSTTSSDTSENLCNHNITGKNPRRCDKKCKEQGTDGLYYCSTHLKSHKKEKVVDDSKVEALVNKLTAETSQVLFNQLYGLAVDGNGICFIGKYKDVNGVYACGRVSGGEVVDLTVEDLAFCEREQYPIVDKADRDEIISLSSSERESRYFNDSL